MPHTSKCWHMQVHRGRWLQMCCDLRLLTPWGRWRIWLAALIETSRQLISLSLHTYVWHWVLRMCIIWQKLVLLREKINHTHFKLSLHFLYLYILYIIIYIYIFNTRAPDAFQPEKPKSFNNFNQKSFIEVHSQWTCIILLYPLQRYGWSGCCCDRCSVLQPDSWMSLLNLFILL